MPDYDNDHLCSLRAALLDHPIYTNIVLLIPLANSISISVASGTSGSNRFPPAASHERTDRSRD
jgi:hypothetical protein